MKTLLRHFLITAISLWITAQILPAFVYTGTAQSLLAGSFLFMVIHFLVVPLIKLAFLPVNLLTMGIFSWVANVVGLYFLTILLPQFKLIPYTFDSVNFNGFIIPGISLNIVQVAILASFLIGLISHFIKWLID